MPRVKKRGKGLWADLQRAYDTYEQHSYTDEPPDEPFKEHWEEAGIRAALIFLGITLAAWGSGLMATPRPTLAALVTLLGGACVYAAGNALGWFDHDSRAPQRTSAESD